MKKIFTLAFLLITLQVLALDPMHFTITRISAPYFIVDGNSPASLTKAYTGFEIKNNNASAMTYSGLKFTITSIGSSVTGQNYSVISPASGSINVGTLAPGESKVCYYYIGYPASTTPQATFNVQLSDNTASSKTQSFTIRNRSSISANAGGTATQTVSSQDLIGGIISDDVTYTVGNVQNGDENDFQVAVSSQFDPTRITLLSTYVVSSTVPGIPAGTTDSLYFISGNGSNGSTVTIRWIFRIASYNFTNYLLPCAGATSGNSNYKYALNTNLGAGTPVNISASANPLTISKSSDQPVYGTNSAAIFTITIQNPGAYGITLDKITDQLPAGFAFQSFHAASHVTALNSTAVPLSGANGNIVFEGGVTSGPNTSYYIPAGGNLVVKYTATTSSSPASNLVTTARGFVAVSEIGSAQNTVSVSTTLPVNLQSLKAGWIGSMLLLEWTTGTETNSACFEIERSLAGYPFTKIGGKQASGTTFTVTAYSFMDSFPAIGVINYRIKMIDRDGQYKYSPVISVSAKGEGIVLENAGPNPFVREIRIMLSSGSRQPVSVELADISGNILYRRNEICRAGSNLFIVEQPGELAQGIYIVRINSGKEQKTIRFVKNR